MPDCILGSDTSTLPVEYWLSFSVVKRVGLLSFNGSCIRVSDHAMVPFYNVRVWLVVINPLVLVLQSLSLGDMRR